MKRYLFRLLVSIVAFSIGTATIYFFAWDTLKNLTPFRTTHSDEINGPYSVLEGKTIKIKPYDATFEIPESWITYKPYSGEPKKNLYLSQQDLIELERFDFNHPLGFDKEDAQVIRSAIPFENCAAHIGSMSWGNGNTNDLQARVFVVDSDSQEITEKIKNQGLGKAQSVFDEAKLASENYGTWEKQKISVFKAEGHTLLYKDITFYYRSFGNKTVAFVFVHQWGWDKTIKQILDSFRWANYHSN